jgi:hypothetical protein
VSDDDVEKMKRVNEKKKCKKSLLFSSKNQKM